MRASGREWVGGCFALRGWLVGDPPFEPEVILWLELPEGVVVGSTIVDPREREPSFAQALRKAMAEPMIGRKRRPTRIRVADTRLADELRSAVGDLIPIAIAATPEIDEAGADLLRMTAAPEPMSSYLAGGRVSAGSVAELFAAAMVLWSVAPWKVAVDGDVLRIDVPELGVEGACLAIIGSLGESLGLLLFSSVEDYDAFATAAGELDTHGAPGPFAGRLLSLHFQRGSELSGELLREIAANKWPIASAEAYPLLEWMGDDSAPDSLQENDVRLAAAVAGAVSAFFARHRDWFENESEEPACESMTGATGLRVRVTVPYEAGDLFDLEPTVAPASRTARVGRNDPCPCGSGKKYKKCHLGIDDARTPPRSNAATLHALDRRLTDSLHTFALRRFGKVWLRELESLRARDAAAEIALKWALFSLPVQGRPIVEWFAGEHDGPLPSEERAWLAAQRAAWLSVWEVTAVEEGTSLRLVDLLSGEVREVREASASRTLRVRDALLGRIVDHAGLSLLCGVHPRPLPPADTATLIRRLRAKLRARAGERISAEHLRDSGLARDLIRRWQRSVDALDASHATPPEVHNTDGHELLFTVDHFEIAKSSRAQVEARLASLPDVSPPSDGDATYDFLRPGSAGTISGSSTIIGFARIRNDALRLETNSLQRADALRAIVESACGALVRHRVREHSDPQALLALDDQRKATIAPAHTSDQQAALRELKARYYADWLDMPIPALGNRTPRQSIRSRTGREQVDLLLKDLENMEARLPEAERFDVGVLRRELGLMG